MDWSRTHCSTTPGPGPSEQHIKRPPNRFFCFLKVWRETHHGPVKDASKAWSELSAEERAHYQELSERKKVEHKLKYPTYRFQRRVKGRRAPKRPVIAEPARIQAAEEQIVADTSRSSGSVVHETDTQIQLSAEPSSLPQVRIYSTQQA